MLEAFPAFRQLVGWEMLPKTRAPNMVYAALAGTSQRYPCSRSCSSGISHQEGGAFRGRLGFFLVDRMNAN